MENKELEQQFREWQSDWYKKIGKQGGISKAQKYSHIEISEMARKAYEIKNPKHIKGDNSKAKYR